MISRIRFVALQCYKHRLAGPGLVASPVCAYNIVWFPFLSKDICLQAVSNLVLEFPLAISPRTDSDRSEIKVEIKKTHFSAFPKHRHRLHVQISLCAGPCMYKFASVLAQPADRPDQKDQACGHLMGSSVHPELLQMNGGHLHILGVVRCRRSLEQQTHRWERSEPKS